MIRMQVLLLSALLLGQSASASDTPCRVIHGGIRVDSIERMNLLQDVCVVEGPIGIFTKGVVRITFPNLQSARLINIEAPGLQAITFPKLKELTFLNIGGTDLQVAEFLALKTVTNLTVFNSRALRFLHLPKLSTIPNLTIQNNPALEWIFFDNLSDVYHSVVTGNPKLHPSVIGIVTATTRVLTAEQQESIQRTREETEETRREIVEGWLAGPPPAPMHRAAVFGDLGPYYPYYQWYPYYFYQYWNFYPTPYYPYY